MYVPNPVGLVELTLLLSRKVGALRYNLKLGACVIPPRGTR